MKNFAVLVAGGTGGHINAALAVGEALVEEGWEVQYLTGKRPLDYKLFHSKPVQYLSSRPLRTNNPIQLLRNVFANALSFAFVFMKFLKSRPRFVVGAGGYVCGPTLLAAFLQGIPVYIIEQNAVMGLTNRILGWISSRIFVHFTQTKGLSPNLLKRVRVVGNPTRKSIQPVPTSARGDKLKVLVFGGSLGATQINEIIYSILQNPPFREMSIHHQIGGDLPLPLINTEVDYLPMNYIDHIQREYEWCDVIISRSGASTVSELRIIRKPTLIIPYPKATDNHQWYNAEIFRQESDFDVVVLKPDISHEDAVEKTKEFLTKARDQELRMTSSQAIENNTTFRILSEIKNDIGLS